MDGKLLFNGVRHLSPQPMSMLIHPSCKTSHLLV
jgi:hypothetical protein